jgi:pilus assembly protein CpaB
VAGKVTPGARVNIIATFAGQREGDPAMAKIIVANAPVIDVGRLTALEPQGDGRRGAFEAVPITFALNTKDTQRVAYAESFAQHVRLALVAPGSDTTLRPGERTYTLDGDK